ncbi:MAG: DUF695 domain-containing protein [Aureispira sp.]
MNFLKTSFNKNEPPLPSYSTFWKWFSKHEQRFYAVIKAQGDIENEFFKELGGQLDDVRKGFYFLAGMSNTDTAELVFTADGIIKNIVFVEELVAAAPALDNWKITALKQPVPMQKSSIKMNDYQFDDSTMNFYSIDHASMPDEIDLVVTHQDWTEENKNVITNGVYLAIDTYLGELHSITTIDNLHIIHPDEATDKLIPLTKLKNFLIWREKEFVEKYKGVRQQTENGNYLSAEATLNNGLPLFAIINADLLEWEHKASHPWLALIQIHYDGEDNNGLPDDPIFELLNEIEDTILEELKEVEGYLNVGRQTADSVREIYLYCVDFRIPSKVLDKISMAYQERIEINFELYKDKYWQTLDRFNPH